MKAYDEIWGVAEDNFGVITSAKAEEFLFVSGPFSGVLGSPFGGAVTAGD